MTHYRWNSVTDTLLSEQDENGNTIATYEHEPGLHGELISQRRNGHTYYHHYDGIGNTLAVTDENQNIVESATYSAFGEVVAKTSSIVNPFGYKGALGYHANPVTNDLDVRARIYKPVIARWLSIDPLEFQAGDDNLYRYVRNSPTNLIDSSGLQPIVIKPKMAISIPRFPKSVNCGDLAEALFVFMLDQPMPCDGDGYFVQKIVARCLEEECKDCRIENVQTFPDLVFYEAFRLPKGTKAFNGVPDTAQTRIKEDACGYQQVIGLVRFYCATDTGNLQEKWGKGVRHSGGKCRITTNGPSTDQLPDFWETKRPIAAGTRVTVAKWHCCTCAPRIATFEPDATPLYVPPKK